MTTQQFKKHIISLVICLFSISTLIADDFLGKATISNDGAGRLTTSEKKPAPKPTPLPTMSVMTPKTVRATPFDNFKGNLLRYDNGNFEKVTLDDSNIEYYAFYFSAHWCSPCRSFTPKLITAYKGLKSYLEELPLPKPTEDENGNVVAGKPHKNFEIIFVSWDHSKHDMFDYVKATEMPWLILDYDQIDKANVVKDNKVHGIPTLLVFDRNGKLIIGSTEAYVSPTKVLNEFKDLVEKQ
jgi:thiol-disulfide isomerase/thioredoxin